MILWILVGCIHHQSVNPLALPANEDELLGLQQFAHQTIAQDEWQNLCTAPRAEIDAKVTLLGHQHSWDQNTLNQERVQLKKRILALRDRYSPKPDIITSTLRTDFERGKAIRDLEDYDQFWASAIVRYPELRKDLSPAQRSILGFLFNRLQCEEQTNILSLTKPILAQSSFPSDKTFGEGTVRALRLITQHADHDPEFQQTMLRRFKENPGSITPIALAYLTDRVNVNQGNLQIYGTQLECIDDHYQPKSVIDPETLDHRRAAIGLEPFAEYAKSVPGVETQFQNKL